MPARKAVSSSSIAGWVMTLKSSKLYENDSTTEKPVRLGTNLSDEREERKGTSMDHMTFTTIFSLLATVGMVLLIMLGMSAFQPPLAEVGKKRVRSIRRKIP
jgi:hypothetical protein